MSAISVPGVLKVSEVAEIVGVSEWSIRKEIKAGRLQTKRIGRITRILDEELTRWLRDYSSSSSARVSTPTADTRPGSDVSSLTSSSRVGTFAQAIKEEA